MEYIAGILAILFLVQTGLFLKYQRQVKDICRQLAFLLKNESNMLITSDIETGGIGRLRDSLNERRESPVSGKRKDDFRDLYQSVP